jgi:hypothetical protein
MSRKEYSGVASFIHTWHDSRTEAPRLYDQQRNYRGKLSANPVGLSGSFGLFGSFGFCGFPIS